MGDTVRVIEIVSYALIVLVGLRLVWVKGRGFIRALYEVGPKSETAAVTAPVARDHLHDISETAAVCSHDHHASGAHSHQAHAHGHDHEHPHEHPGHAHDHAHAHAHEHGEEDSVLPWGHAHGPEPQDLAGPGGWRRGLSAIVAVGLRPCSGAILVLVFALAQGLFWAGIASTFVMGLGTAVTVAAIATLAVAAKGIAKRFAATRAGYGALVLRGIEVCAALVVTAFGVLLLSGFMASERMGMF
jgi:nickel/cobalt transporter (NicO) family protein